MPDLIDRQKLLSELQAQSSDPELAWVLQLIKDAPSAVSDLDAAIAEAEERGVTTTKVNN